MTGRTDVVVLHMPLYKNPFLWMSGILGFTLIALFAEDDGLLSTSVRVCVGITAAVMLLSVLLFRAKLTIGPAGFRERMPPWLDVEFTWADVSEFFIRTDEEALDAVGYVVRGREAEGPRIIAGAYPGRLGALCERLNEARERALAARPPPRVS